MQTAYLILAHHQPSHLARLIKALDCDWASFFIHIDRKSDISRFEDLVPNADNIVFLRGDKRVKVYWAGFSQVQATLNLLHVASQVSHFSRYCLLSGSDFPIKPTAAIEDAFSSDKEFLRVQKQVEFSDRDIRRRHYFDNSWTNPRTAPKMIARITTKVLATIPKARYRKLPLYHGSQWWSLTGNSINYILEFVAANKDYSRFFKDTRAADEVFFHSIVKASPFAKNIMHDFENAAGIQRNVHGCHYVDWTWNKKVMAGPKVLELADINAVLDSNALFARKFDELRSAALLEYIEKMGGTPQSPGC
jgi:hypothetical protein